MLHSVKRPRIGQQRASKTVALVPTDTQHIEIRFEGAFLKLINTCKFGCGYKKNSLLGFLEE